MLTRSWIIDMLRRFYAYKQAIDQFNQLSNSELVDHFINMYLKHEIFYAIVNHHLTK